MENFCKIADLRKKGLNNSQIARRMKVDVKTVRKYLKMDVENYSDYKRNNTMRKSIMDEYDEYILKTLLEFPEISSAQIYDWLREAHLDFKPSYASVRQRIAFLRKNRDIPKKKFRLYEAVQELPFGQQAQVDMGIITLAKKAGGYVKIYIFAMVLSASRKKFICFQTKPFDSVDFKYAHEAAFQYFGGRPIEIVYDQDRVMCVSENNGDIIYTENFQAFKEYAGFSIRLCRSYDPESKGQIESVVKYAKYNFLKNRIFESIDLLNEQGLAWLERTGNGLIHNTTKKVPNDVFQEEREYLVPVAAMPQKAKQLQAYTVRKDHVVNYHSNRYAVPLGTYSPGKQVYLVEDGEMLKISDLNGNLIIAHPLCRDKGKLIAISHPERDLSSNTKELQEEVLALLGGTQEAELYLIKLKEAFPRYVKDQLFALKKAATKFEKKIVCKVLSYCVEHSLFSATLFKDALEYHKVPEFVSAAISAILPVQYAKITAQQRDITEYINLEGGPKF